ncbi:ribbon-helix-helix protein, CopG family [Desulfofundulus thermobenzoicus]|uniref:Ribbon-helix-helix protein, CopG family n=1 Tax=Desulfofundulus thermobenzoicus TaxID=29376 RepID=A0A6N7ILP2_9FIRM|nr:ribbon-helix-helix domain-containing protein [Desulfofundulus thermobenzoicus]MQL50834.1 ribbon-helix-helix protein, CopG family [Desulfofundulus thermobenzoicus]
MPRVTVRLPPEQLAQLEALKKCLNRDNKRLKATTSDLVRAAIEAYIRQWQFLAWRQGGSYKLNPKRRKEG